MRALALTAALILAAPAAALAQPPAPAPKAAADKGEGVGYLAGRWRVEARDPGSPEVLTVDYVVEPAPGGAWLAGAGASTDGSLKSRDMWGRDPLTGEILRVVFDGSGAFGIVRSPGWKGDVLVLEGDVRSPGGTVRVRETITRRGPNRFDAVWEALRDGKWQAYSFETVTRRS